MNRYKYGTGQPISTRLYANLGQRYPVHIAVVAFLSMSCVAILMKYCSTRLVDLAACVYCTVLNSVLGSNYSQVINLSYDCAEFRVFPRPQSHTNIVAVWS